jgi:peptide deformylase
MALLTIIKSPDPRLKVKSLPVEKVNDEIREFMLNMVETMYAEGGIGLAAVQVEVHKRILVMDLNYGSDRYEETKKHDKNKKPSEKPFFVVNPEIIKCSAEESVFNEGCLSFPGQYSEVIRPKIVKVRYLDFDGKEQLLEADELLSTCIQHEIDHLNGITFVDRISKLKRDIILKKMKKLSKD